MKQIKIGLKKKDFEEEIRQALISKEKGLYLVYNEEAQAWPWIAYDNTGEFLITEAFQTMEGAVRWLLYEGRDNASA